MRPIALLTLCFFAGFFFNALLASLFAEGVILTMKLDTGVKSTRCLQLGRQGIPGD